jgi:protein gp37
MQDTSIKWTEKTWGVVSGCTKVSPGCKHCYAETLCENKRGSRAFPNGFDITPRPWKLGEAAAIKRPTLIFCNSTSDFFHEKIEDSYRDQIFAAISATPRHRYQVLTKRPEEAARYFSTRKVPDCVWLGVTIESQEYAWRADVLRRIDAQVRFVSAEPLIGPLELNLSEFGEDRRTDGIHWVIVGGESGSHLSNPAVRAERGLSRKGDRTACEPLWVPREDRVAWVRSLRDQCDQSGAAFFFKQWGGARPESAGRMLDGSTHDGLPDQVIGAMPAGERIFADGRRHLPERNTCDAKP